MFFGKAAAVMAQILMLILRIRTLEVIGKPPPHFYKNGGNSILLDDEKFPKIMVLSETNLYRKMGQGRPGFTVSDGNKNLRCHTVDASEILNNHRLDGAKTHSKQW